MDLVRHSIVVMVIVLAAGCIRAEEPVKTDAYDLMLLSFENKIQAVKAVHEISGMGIKDSKDLVESVPKAILAGVTKDEAEKARKHAEALTCKVEIRPAQPGAARGPAHKFEVVLLKANPASAEEAKAVASAAGKDVEWAQGAMRNLPLTLIGDQLLGVADVKIAALEAAGCKADVVSTGGVETGGFSVVLNKIDAATKIRAIAVVREHTGLNLARTKTLVETLPHVVKIKISKDEAEKIKAALEKDKATVEVKESGK